MGKYFAAKIVDHYIYYTSHDDGEQVHAHANKQRMTEPGSAKIWVTRDGTTEVADYGRVSRGDMSKIRKYIEDNYKTVFKKWEDTFGPFEIKGEPNKIFVVVEDELYELVEQSAAAVKSTDKAGLVLRYGSHSFSSVEKRKEVALRMKTDGCSPDEIEYITHLKSD